MRHVRHLLESKPTEVHAIAPDAPVIEALRLMAEKGIGAVLVLDGPRLAGILSERDYARKVVLLGRNSTDTPVRDIMSGEVHSVGHGHSVDDCMQLMTDRRIRHLPVVDDGEVVGIISIGDLVKAVIEEQQAELRYLQDYIAS